MIGYIILISRLPKDPIFIKEFTSYFGELRPDTSISHIDARIMAIVTYKYIEKKDTLCFGEYHGVDLNGTFMKDIPEFLLLVKKEVWPRDVPDTNQIYTLLLGVEPRTVGRAF